MKPPKPKEPISPTEALQILLAGYKPHAAAGRLTKAMREDECSLWCNGNLLASDYITNALVVVARPEADGRWHAEIVSSVREAWEKETYSFEFDAPEIPALLPPAPVPAPPSTAGDSPPSQRRKPGPKLRYNWRLHVAAEVHRVREKGQRTPTASELALWCSEKWDGWQPDESDIHNLLRFLLDD